MRPIIVGMLALWLVVVFWLGAAGAFVRAPGTPPFPILIGATAPVVVFLAAYWGSAAFHSFTLSIDLPLAAAVQAWRAGGLGFLALYAHGVLPGSFAWPAGMGDIAIGVTAPWVTLALVRRPRFVSSRVFVVWNLLGILDLVVAVSVGGLSSLLATGAAGEVTTAPMAQLPLLLIPAYLVPLFIVLHLSGLLQSRRQASNDHSGGTASRVRPRCGGFGVRVGRGGTARPRPIEAVGGPLIPSLQIREPLQRMNVSTTLDMRHRRS